ncbi:MAG TPA: peptidoglycan DD-metalloendopeptidase family protein [Acidimicrobiales bacterium]
MISRRALAVVATVSLVAAAVLGVMVTSAGRAWAQTPPDASDSASDSGLSSDSTTTTAPPEITLPTLPQAPDTTTPPPTTEDPGTNGDAPPESVPQTPDTVPPEPAPSTPGAVAPPPNRVVQVDVRTARASALARQAAYEAAVANRQQLEATLANVQGQVDQLNAAGQQAIKNLTDAHDDLVARAIDAYMRGPDDIEEWSDDQDQVGQRTALLSAIADRDNASIARYKAAQAQVTSDQAKTAQSLTDTQALLAQAKVDEAQAQLDLNSAQLELAVTSAGGNVVIHGFVFPVAPPHTFSEDFGDPRLPGTPQAHTHQGCDIVAAEGTELYAAEHGIITQLSSGGLGGNGIWLKGESGTSYYYAHLSAYVVGLQTGMVVEAGQLIGYVGHTGDAYGPHLHFEVHPGGGPAVDPYPILLAADPQSATTKP